MGYVTAVTDRTALDITNRTSKAFMNVADWARVYGNAELVNSLTSIMADVLITFGQLTAPTITSIPSVTDVNTLAGNIEATRLAAVADGATGISTEIKDNYIGGAQGDSPKYTDINLWESTLDAIWIYYDGASLPVCPTLTGDLTVPTGTNVIYVDCLDFANFNVDLQGTANLIII